MATTSSIPTTTKKPANALSRAKRVRVTTRVVSKTRPGRFVAAKTGRVVKSSPTPPRLGESRIQAAVEAVVKNHKRS